MTTIRQRHQNTTPTSELQFDRVDSLLPRRRLGFLPAVGFVIAYATFLVVGLGATFVPPRAKTGVAGVSIAADSKCFRVQRRADYTTVEMSVGGPSRRVRLLLRLDRVVDDSDRTVRLFSERLVESQSLTCEPTNASCYDTVLASLGNPNNDILRYALHFEYTNPTVEYYRYGVARYQLNLDGELYAARGYRYYLIATHLCISRDEISGRDAGDTSDALASSITPDGYVVTNASSIASMPESLFGSSAIFTTARSGACDGLLDTVEMLPSAAASEVSYLAISDSKIYQTEPETVKTRRQIVELGYQCASTVDAYDHAFNMYDLDCNNVQATCRTGPSLPFRRLSTMSFRVHYLSNNRVFWWFENDSTLYNLPNLGNSADAIWLSVVKLLLLILAAAVVWVRSDRVTSSSHWLYRHCVQTANSVRNAPASPVVATSSVLEDAALGLLATTSRLVVAVWRFGQLQYDDQARVCYVEGVAGLVSMASWIVRFWVIEPNLPQLVGGGVRVTDAKGPLTRLGGSMAIVDASCAVLLAFAEPPIYLGAISRFDNTARLLTGLLLSLVTLHRCLFGVCCNAIIYEAHTYGYLTSSRTYTNILVGAAICWVVQVISVAVAIADLVASPMAFTLTRGVVGDSSAVRSCLFLVLVTASLPRLLHTAVKLSGDARSYE